MSKHRIWIVVVLMLFVLSPGVVYGDEDHAVAVESTSYTISYHEKGSPNGLVPTASPVISYYVKLSNYDLAYDMEMLLNGEKVSASYNEESGMLTYQAKGLSGENTVTVRSVVHGVKQLERTWSFEVDRRNLNPFASTDESVLSTVEDDALQRANEYRERLGAPMLKRNDQLKSAAQAHANYIQSYTKGHYESASHEDLFTGKKPAQRTAFFGYPKWFVGEGITYQEPGGQASIDHLFDAPYHRMSLMNPFYNEAGTGYNDEGDFVMNFGGEGSNGEHHVIQYPYANQEDVPVSWYAYESPNPLRFFNQDKVWTGYPISYVYYGPSSDELQVDNVELTDESGEVVESYTITPDMEDEGDHHVFIIPHDKLSPGEEYKASVQAQVTPGDGEAFDVSRTWSFTTGENIAFKDIYFEDQNDIHFLTLEWMNGEDPKAQITLEKNGQVYLEKKGNTQRNVRSLESGTYQLKVDSPHFDQEETYTVKIQSGDIAHYESGSELSVTNFYQSDSLEALYQKYPIWEAGESAYGAHKEWTISFNTQVNRSSVNGEQIFIVNSIGETIATSLKRNGRGDSITVMPPEKGYSNGEYRLIIKPLENTDGLMMDSGLQMPFTVQS
ncbi:MULTISPECIES: CAP domain-containing protein [Pontibacillus]|uniref:CAP domain-containing protein n=1 Tax=Pontibacillus chungwhensis TaxID=265426 RepID=A0ABY8V1V7_9BACI|nr:MULTISPECIES: CAP domain-containing protein [Pontibacillus]MCD5325461.1 CAP domain-containing protein [Pontibacillus sp. HN14]WIF98574.1 CAP domain-containing protein [Pontibacillus chungwhensis]